MLRLKNIKIWEEKATADFYPEDGNNAGHIVVSLVDGEIVSCDDVPNYGDSYKAHARQSLVRMAKEKDNRSENLIMWY